nr:hypothetical protein [Tanacetum cinerariifolium]
GAWWLLGSSGKGVGSGVEVVEWSRKWGRGCCKEWREKWFGVNSNWVLGGCWEVVGKVLEVVWKWWSGAGSEEEGAVRSGGKNGLV